MLNQLRAAVKHWHSCHIDLPVMKTRHDNAREALCSLAVACHSWNTECNKWQSSPSRILRHPKMRITLASQGKVKVPMHLPHTRTAQAILVDKFLNFGSWSIFDLRPWCEMNECVRAHSIRKNSDYRELRGIRCVCRGSGTMRGGKEAAHTRDWNSSR